VLSFARGAMLVVTLICWILVIYKLRDLSRDPGNRPLRALSLALVAITLSLTIQPIAPWIDQILGLPDLARFMSNCLSLTCATAAQAFLLYMTSDDNVVRRQVRHRWGALGVTVAVMIALLILVPPPVAISDPQVLSREYYPHPYNAPFMYVYLTYLAWSLVQVVILATRYARVAHRPLLRFGLRLIALGAIFGLGYAVVKLLAIATLALWPGSGVVADPPVIIAFTTSILLVLIGTTIPSWGPRIGLDRVWAWATALRDCYRLRPFWSAIHTVLPEIALLPTPTGVRGVATLARDASLRRVRMTVEILDGYASLRPWMSEQILTQAHRAGRESGLVDEQLAAFSEAAVVAGALTARRSGQPPATDADGVPMLPTSVPGDTHASGNDGGAPAQVIWLIQVSRAYRSPMVASVLAQVPPPTVPTVSHESER
jgi:hypothetical protein